MLSTIPMILNRLAFFNPDLLLCITPIIPKAKAANGWKKANTMLKIPRI